MAVLIVQNAVEPTASTDYSQEPATNSRDADHVDDCIGLRAVAMIPPRPEKWVPVIRNSNALGNAIDRPD